MSLRDYAKKRRFDRTPEPRPEDSARRAGRELFVVQLHHARRRHYDFRLQVGDVLKSWACPKGPSYDPAVKRLAVEVEDHPVSYAAFQGDIPDGYGAGHVDTFDTGVWATEGDAEAQLAKGHLRFQLFGKRLKGSWHLVRSHRAEKKPAWFLIKDKDRYASNVEADDLLDEAMVKSTERAAGKSGGAKEVAEKLHRTQRKAPPAAKKKRHGSMAWVGKINGARQRAMPPGFFKPELAKLRETAPNSDDWLNETKWDGYRILTSIADGNVEFWSRNALPWTQKLPEIRQAVEALGLDSAQLDGELIAVTNGQSDFNALQQTLSGERASPLVYVLFDVPYMEGYDLSRAALIDRKDALERLLADAPGQLRYSAHIVGNGDDVFCKASEAGLEGIICKRVDSPYRSGRGDDWVKVKRLESDEFAVVGYVAAKGTRQGFGSFLLAKPAADGGWTYIGRVGTGFSDDMLRELAASLAHGGSPKPTTKIKNTAEAPRDAKWIEPTAIAEVFYRGIGNQGLLRQASLKAMRPDKSPKDLRDSDRPRVRSPAKRAAKSIATKSKAMKSNATKSRNSAAADSQGITITHPDRLAFPDDGITKQDVVDYYQAVMPWFLPGVLDRPLSVIRWPDGINKPSFFQKHLPTGGLRFVGTERLKEESGASAVYLYPTGPDSIIELVQYNAIEFHLWGSHVDNPDCADRVVFDLDPGPNVEWSRVKAAARLVHELLDQLKLKSYLRTTGGKGLHIVVPLNPPAPWEMVKEFAHSFAQTLEVAHPLDFVSMASKAKRGGKIYVDYLRNGRGATAIASYSLRGRTGAPVAMPLRWEELARLRSAAQFDLRSALARVKRQRVDPWKGIDQVKQSLKAVLKSLASA